MSGKKCLETFDTKYVNNIIKLVEKIRCLGVKSITVGEIDIVFDSSQKTIENETAQHTENDKVVANQYEKVPEESFINEELDINEIEAEVRMLTDSLAFEKEIFGENQETLNIGSKPTL